MAELMGAAPPDGVAPGRGAEAIAESEAPACSEAQACSEAPRDSSAPRGAKGRGRFAGGSRGWASVGALGGTGTLSAPVEWTEMVEGRCPLRADGQPPAFVVGVIRPSVSSHRTSSAEELLGEDSP